jgi:acylphosphatase
MARPRTCATPWPTSHAKESANGAPSPLDCGGVIRRRVVVRGDVQGVFFRESCRREALTAGVSGWIRNRADGSVEAVFEGSEEAVDSLCSWCRHGPPHARVEQVDVRAEPARGDSSFMIR